MELPAITSLLSEIDLLKKKSELLDIILKFWDKETMTFLIPDKWDRLSRFSKDSLTKIPKTPRHGVNKNIHQSLPYSISENLVNWDKLDETAAQP